MHNPAIDKAEKLHGIKSMYMFDGTLRSSKEVQMIVRAAKSEMTKDQIRDRLNNGFDTLEKMLKPLSAQARAGGSKKPERLQLPHAYVKTAQSIAVDCAECGQESPLLFWRIGNRERYRCTRCQTIFEVEVR